LFFGTLYAPIAVDIFNLRGFLVCVAVFEGIRGSVFGGSSPQKSFSTAQKQDSLFSDLVKKKAPEPESNASETSSKVVPVEKVAQPSRKEVAQENLATVPTIEETPIIEDAPIIIAEEVAVESVIMPPLPVVEFDSLEEPQLVIAEEETFEEIVPIAEEVVAELVAEEKMEEEAELETEYSIIKAKEPFAEKLDTIEEAVAVPLEAEAVAIVEQNIVVPVAAPAQDNIVSVEVAHPLDLNKLPPQEQAMHQNFKTLDSSNTLEAPVADFNEPVAKIPSEESSKPKELLSKFEPPVAIKVENISEEAPKKPVVIQSLNLALADTTRDGSTVISRMQAPDNTKLETTISAVEGEVLIDTEAMLSDLGGKNDNSSSRSSLPLSEFGAVIKQTTDETFNVTFKGQLSSSQNNTPKPAEQVSLAVNEVLNSSSTDGKKQITINLHPHTLGAIKVEILSQMGQDGASKVESIKISAEKNETLVMLEERKAELAKSLREVTNTKEEASLQFEMNQGQGKNHGAACFDSPEERDTWMRQFAGVVANEELLHGEGRADEYATRGIATEIKIDLVA